MSLTFKKNVKAIRDRLGIRKTHHLDPIETSL